MLLIEIDGRSLGQRAHVPPSKVLRKAFRRLGLPDETQSESIWKMAWEAIVPGREAAGPANEHGPFYPYDELVSPRYFQFTVAFLARQWWAPAKSSQEPASQFGEANEALVYPDGSLEWWNNALAQTPETIRQKFDELHTTAIADEAYRPVPQKCSLYEAFVDGPPACGSRGRVRAPAAESLVLRTGRAGVEASRETAPLARGRGGHSLDWRRNTTPGARLA